MLELICEHTERLAERSNRKEETVPSIHHYAVFVSELEKASKNLEEMGFAEILYAETASGFPFAMHDARNVLGHFIEIYEPNEDLTGFYRMVEESSVNE